MSGAINRTTPPRAQFGWCCRLREQVSRLRQPRGTPTSRRNVSVGIRAGGSPATASAGSARHLLSHPAIPDTSKLGIRTFLALLLVAVTVSPTAAIELSAQTIAAWNRYVAADTPHLHEYHAACCQDEPHGRAIDIVGGTIHHWKGSTLVHRTTVDRVVNALMYPGTPPPQDDVLESRVLGRNGNSLRVYLKLSRSAIVTVVYDTEHDVVFRRHSGSLASSRSVSTRIVELGGGDRGFLWRLNSYWRYTQVGGDVRVELESISLSRDVPSLVRPIAEPIVNRIARESVERTLSSVRRFLEEKNSSLVRSDCDDFKHLRQASEIVRIAGVQG